MAKWTKETISDVILSNVVNGCVSSSDVGMTVSTMAGRIFGSFGNACRYCGVISKSERPKTVTCQVADCSSDTRSSHAKLCEVHYYRLRRNGSFDLPEKSDRRVRDGRYIAIKAPEHQLAMKGGWAYEHRVILFDSIGTEGIKCHWCDMDLSWNSTSMHVDHLDCNIHNNNIKNLVPSCIRCNIARGKDKSAASARARGRIIEYEGDVFCVSEWARIVGITSSAMTFRLENGWDAKKCITTPKGVTGPKRKTSEER